METFPQIDVFAAILTAGLIFIFLFILFVKIEQTRRLRISLNSLKKSFEELDEQAKLIVKTDLELNKTQEELDKRLASLNALQKTSRLISTTLDEKEIFRRLDQSLMMELGFEKNLILMRDQEGKLAPRTQFGFSNEDAEFVASDLPKNMNLSTALEQGQIFSSVVSSAQYRDLFFQLFNVEHFVLSPILTKNGIIGMIFVGNLSNAAPITEGDEELVSILANQIGQSLENARLFEEIFKSSQALELKIQDRTKQLASALEEVQKISKAKSEFISAVSHELRTPLTSIKGYASILMTGKLGSVPKAVKERLEKINIHSDNLVKLINDLLDISRIESGRVEMKMESVHLGRVVEDVHDLLTPQLREKKIQWAAEISDKIPEMFLDRTQIERVFINLVSNAVKFTPENGTITIRAASEEKTVKIEVADTGIGINEKDTEKLFNEFYRVDNPINQKVKGTGLGLALVKKIVEAHKGKIGVTSALNTGTTFHLTLPVVNPKAPEESGE